MLAELYRCCGVTIAKPVNFVFHGDSGSEPNKKYYDPRKWLRAGQETLVDRVVVAFNDLNAMDRN